MQLTALSWSPNLCSLVRWRHWGPLIGHQSGDKLSPMSTLSKMCGNKVRAQHSEASKIHSTINFKRLYLRNIVWDRRILHFFLEFPYKTRYMAIDLKLRRSMFQNISTSVLALALRKIYSAIFVFDFCYFGIWDKGFTILRKDTIQDKVF